MLHTSLSEQKYCKGQDLHDDLIHIYEYISVCIAVLCRLEALYDLVLMRSNASLHTSANGLGDILNVAMLLHSNITYFVVLQKSMLMPSGKEGHWGAFGSPLEISQLVMASLFLQH